MKDVTSNQESKEEIQNHLELVLMIHDQTRNQNNNSELPKREELIMMSNANDFFDVLRVCTLNSGKAQV